MNTPPAIAKRLPWAVPQSATVHVHQLNLAKTVPHRVAHMYVVEDGTDLQVAVLFSADTPLNLTIGQMIDNWVEGILGQYCDGYTMRPFQIAASTHTRSSASLPGQYLECWFGATVGD